jgi:hypothetical protein
MSVIRAADAAGDYVSLTEAQGVADEYWSMMRLKPQLKAQEGPLAGTVVLVAAEHEAGGDAITIADTLAAAQAHIVLVGVDPARVAEADLTGRHGERRVVAVPDDGDVASRLRNAVVVYGGFDVVLDMTPRGDVARSALRVFDRQSTGGLAVLVRPDTTDTDRRRETTRLIAEPVARDVDVSVLVAVEPEAIGEAVVFLAASRNWRSAVVHPNQAQEEVA